MKKVVGNIGRMFLTFAVVISMFSGLKTYSHAEENVKDTVVIDFSKNRTKHYNGEAVDSNTLDKSEFWEKLNDEERDVVFLNALVYYNRLFTVLNPDGSVATFNGATVTGNGSYEIDKSKNQYIKFATSGSGALSTLHADESSTGTFEIELDYKKLYEMTPEGKDRKDDAKMPFYVLDRYGVNSFTYNPDGTFDGYFKLRIEFGDKEPVVEPDPSEEEKPEPTPSEEENPEPTPSNDEKTEVQKSESVEKVVLDSEFVEAGYSYKVTADGEVAFVTAADKKAKTVNIPDTVKHQNVTYKVTSISNKALYNFKKLKCVTVGNNVTSIGSNAFAKSAKLKTVKIYSTTLSKIGNKAFSKNSKNLVVKVPKKQLKSYKKLLKKAKVSSLTLKKIK